MPTLASAELNPLVNPLLAENMGRWAETYFTSAPENREQAVLDLIRQLETEKASAVNTQKGVNASGEYPSAQEMTALARCQTCGHQNPVSHNFCGMCGAPAGDSGGASREPQKSRKDLRRDSFEEFSDATSDGWDSYEAAAPMTHELSLFQNVAGAQSDYDQGSWVYEVSPSRYRGWMGALLAIVIVGLGYLAWHGMQNSKFSEVSPAPPPVAKEIPAPVPAAAATPPVANAEPPISEKKEADPVSAPQPKPKQPPPVAERTSSRAAGLDTGAKPPEASAGQYAGGNGSEELAVAQRFLSGTSGQGRDPAEAAKWFWKAIRDHNSLATVPLADLYLKGEGVSKNCDQARVLLDSAARKGVSGAAERIRNLQAFGCQ